MAHSRMNADAFLPIHLTTPMTRDILVWLTEPQDYHISFAFLEPWTTRLGQAQPESATE